MAVFGSAYNRLTHFHPITDTENMRPGNPLGAQGASGTGQKKAVNVNLLAARRAPAKGVVAREYFLRLSRNRSSIERTSAGMCRSCSLERAPGLNFGATCRY